MKKILMFSFGLTSLICTAQKTIIEEKFEKENRPLKYHLLPKFNQIFIEKGKIPGMSWKRNIKTVASYNADGSSKLILKNGNQMDLNLNEFDSTVFCASEFASMKWENDFKIYSDDLSSDVLDRKLNPHFFNKDFLFSIGNEDKPYSMINVLKDDLFLIKTGIKTKKTEKIKLDIPFKNNDFKAYYKLKKVFCGLKKLDWCMILMVN
jgi:hypothetical protein